MAENLEKWNVKRVSNVSVLYLLLLTLSELVIVTFLVVLDQNGSLSSRDLSIFNLLDVSATSMVYH